MSRGGAGGSLLLMLGSLLLALLVIELGLRLLTVEGPDGQELLGIQLPPRRFVEAAPTQRSSPAGFEAEEGIVLTVGDLNGFYRRDPALGYAPLESSASRNGWWQTDSIGALRRDQTSPRPAAGVRRVLVFGSSFVRGSRLPLEASWPAVLDARREDLEVVNLGVDGYGLGQALLRYQELGDRVAHDVVLLTVVPQADHWRDLSMSRELAAPGWGYFPINPRFTLEDSGLALVSPGRETGVGRRPGRTLGDRERALLERHDPFYVAWVFQPPPVLRRVTLARWLIGAWAEHRRARLLEEARSWDPESDAALLARAVVRAMAERAARSGASFGVVVLPETASLGRIRSGGLQRRLWEDWTDLLCGPDVPCLDLASALVRSSSAPDSAADGTHFGPRANRLVAGSVEDFLDSMEIAPPAAGSATGRGEPRFSGGS